MELRYLYVGSSDTGRDVEAWLLVPGAALRWRFQHFGADVAAIDLGGRPTVLLADHRPTGSVLPIYAVDDLDDVITPLAERGWTVEAQGFGTPEGPAAVLRDPSHPARLLPAYDSGDHVHPNDAGYRAMADAIDLSLFEEK